MSLLATRTEIHTHGPSRPFRIDPRWESYALKRQPLALSYHPAWLGILERGLQHEPYCLEATRDGQITGLLPLLFVKSWLFGRFLVGLPYLNVGGVMADDDETAHQLVDRALELAEQLNVKHLELRQEQPVEHPRLETRSDLKVHMRLGLPSNPETLWKSLKSEVRNLVRKGEKHNLTVKWGREDLLDSFYDIFAVNMRDLGTPVFSRRLFAEMLSAFPDRCEIGAVHLADKPIASAILMHGWGITEVPSASALRKYNHTSANMLMYWHLLQRAIDRGQQTFDFGRSTPDCGTYRFKKQWGAEPVAASWQYAVRRGSATDLHRNNRRYGQVIRLWQRLPISATRCLGPVIVRGIP